MDRAVFGVLAPLVQKDLALSSSQLGLAFSLFFIGYTASVMVGGWLVDRFSAHRVLLISMTCWSILCGLTAAVWGFASLLVVRSLFGIAESPWQPGASKILAKLFGRERFASAYGLQGAGNPIGAALSGPIAGLSAAAFGWRIGFVVVASFGILWVIAWLISGIGRDSKTQPEKTIESAMPVDGRGTGFSWRSLASPTVVASALCMMGTTYLLTFFLTWFPSYLSSQLGLSLKLMSVVVVLPWILGACGIAIGGLVSDWLGRKLGNVMRGRKTVLITCLSGAALGVVALPFVRSPVISMILMSLSLGLNYLAGGNIFALIVDSGESKHLGSVISTLVMIGNLCGIAAPYVTGLLIQYGGGYAVAFLVTAALVSGSALAIALLLREQARPSA